jgi:hypothetical protein
MGKILDDYDNYPGWVHMSKLCLNCEYIWEEYFHVWMNWKFRALCPACGKPMAVKRNIRRLPRKEK